MNALVPAGQRGFQYLSRLLEILAPNRGDLAVLLEAYFDESGTHDNSPVMSVAENVYEGPSCLALDLEWKGVLEDYHLPHFRMVDCAHGNDPFDHLTPTERDLAARRVIGLINRHALSGFYCTVSEGDFSEHMPNPNA